MFKNDLFLGEYWVDPNEGDSKDAILVHCDMEKKATCIIPKPEKSAEIRYEGKDSEIWLGEISNGFKVISKCLILLIDLILL